MALQLLVTVGPDMGTVFDLPAGKTLVLGREDDCEIQLADARISRNHCRIVVEGGRATLEDLKSSWGTLVNGQKVETHSLQPDDVITLVETQLKFQVASKANAVTWAPMDSAPTSPPKPVPEPQEQKPSAKDTTPPQSATQARPLEELVGKTLHRYQILEILAKTQSGMLFRALDTKHQKPAALKVLWPEFTQNKDDVNRFVRAIKSLAGIRHKNLIRVSGAGQAGPYCWIATEFLDADSLEHLIQSSSEKKLPWKQMLQVTLEIARGLEAAGKHNVVHRNITPANILIRRKDGSAKLGDLLLAKALEGGAAEKITKPGETVGELSFIAPEQLLAAGDIDTRADIYSLGAVAYAALTGQPPLTGKTLSETLRNIQTAEPEKPSAFNPSIPSELETILLRMLAKKPDSRFASAGELVTELETLARMHGMESEEVSQAEESVPQAVPVAQAVPLAVPVAQAVPVAVPVAQAAPETTGWMPPVEEESIVSRMKHQQSKPRNAGKNTTLIYAGGIGGGLIVLVAVLVMAGFFGGGKKTPSKDPSLAKAETESKTENASRDDSPGGIPLSQTPEEKPAPVPVEPMELPDLIRTIEPSVVRINVTTLTGETGNGSGFVSDEQGTLVTNYHVIEYATGATAMFADGQKALIEGVLFADVERDIAILQLNHFGLSLKPLKLAKATPPKGESVVAFGAPLGLDFTASEGIVSGIRKAEDLETLGIEGHKGTWIQTTAPISPGNSGGPLVNRLGEVVAINTLTFRLGQNLNLAISASDVTAALAQKGDKPESLALLAQKSLKKEFGLADADQPPIEPDALAELQRLQAVGSRQLSRYATRSKTKPLYADQKQEWTRQIVDAYKKEGLRNSRWDKQAELLLSPTDDGDDPEKVHDAANSAIAVGCKDPAVLTICALHSMGESPPKALDLGKQAMNGLETSKYSPNIRFQLRLLYFALQSQLGEKQSLIDNTLAALKQDYLNSCASPNLSDFQRRMIYEEARKTLSLILQERELEFLRRLESEPKIDPWLKEMLTGLIHHTLGWRARGDGLANSVTKEQFVIFHQKMSQAQSHWLKAWRLRPEYPEATTELLRATMAFKRVAGADERFWLERAVEAEFDYKPAYEAYLWSLRPRWGGSHDLMLAFGQECLATYRYDTTVPWQYHQAVLDIASELDEKKSQIYHRPGILEDYRQVLAGYRSQTQDPTRLHLLDSQLACILYLAGESKEGKKVIDRLGKNIERQGFESFSVNMEAILGKNR